MGRGIWEGLTLNPAVRAGPSHSGVWGGVGADGAGGLVQELEPGTGRVCPGGGAGGRASGPSWLEQRARAEGSRGKTGCERRAEPLRAIPSHRAEVSKPWPTPRPSPAQSAA